MQNLPDAASLTPDQQIERWKIWMKETETEAFHLYASRFIFENIQTMFRTNETLSSTGGNLYNWLARNFRTELLISIRKEMEKGGGFLTLVNFLIELEQFAETVLTKTRFVALYSNPMFREYGISDEQFNESPGATCRYPRDESETDYISADSIRRRREQLEADTKQVVRFANWFVAHRTRQKAFRLTFADLYMALNRIFDTYAVYYRIITGAVWTAKFPEPQYDWTKPFTVAWITSDFVPFRPPK